MFTERLGKAQTVLGLVDPGSLGVTLTHEHLSIVSSPFFHPPPDPSKAQLPFTLGNLGWIQRYPYSHHENLLLNHENDAVLEEMKLLKALGCGTVVDNTIAGIHRDVRFEKLVASKTGLHVIAGTGFYVDPFQVDSVRQLSEEKMVDTIVRDITEGVDGTDIRCGIIGEVGCSWPLTDFEKRSVRAAAAGQELLGAPVTFHPGRHPDSPFEIIRIFQEAGGSVRNVDMSHLDRTISDDGTLLEFAALGTYCQYDLFGIEVAYYQHKPITDMPNDGQRINKILKLIDDGKEDRILISHDVHTKHRLLKYGGHGFTHILENVVPHMRVKGITEEVISKILKENPQQWLTFLK